MENTTRNVKTGGEDIRVHDRDVWTEIHYLDSPSDYREHLQQGRQCDPNDDRLSVLASLRRPLRTVRDCSSLPAVVCFVVPGLIAACVVFRLFLQYF
jgi:hypothetical protein